MPTVGVAPASTDLVIPDSHITLRALSLVDQGEEVLVGSSELGVFLAVPQVGAIALRELQRSGSVADATAVASAYAGSDVNVADFAATLVDAGLVAAVDGRPIAPPATSRRPRTRLDRLSPELVRPLYSPSAWVVYGLLFAACLCVFVTRPQLWPSFEDLFFYPNPAVVVVGMVSMSIVLAFCHEVSHWLAARAAGIRPRFTISLRWFFPVFETDLSDLWSLPARQRYSAMLAGMAWDVCVLSTCLALRLAWSNGILDVPPLLVRIAGLIVVLEVLALAWQALVFLRTDLYAVLVTRLGCLNLYRVSTLELRRRVGLLRAAEAAELAGAHPRDLRAAAWFGVVTLAGIIWAGLFFVSFFIPGTIVVVGWTVESIGGASPSSAVFWEALAIAVVSVFQSLLPLAIFAWQRTGWRRGATA
jgi:hypothetical protein